MRKEEVQKTITPMNQSEAAARLVEEAKMWESSLWMAQKRISYVTRNLNAISSVYGYEATVRRACMYYPLSPSEQSDVFEMIVNRERDDQKMMVEARENGEITGFEWMEVAEHLSQEAEMDRWLWEERQRLWDVPLHEFYFETDIRISDVTEGDQRFLAEVRQAMNGQTFRQCLETTLDGVLSRVLEPPSDCWIYFWRVTLGEKYSQKYDVVHLWVNGKPDEAGASMIV